MCGYILASKGRPLAMKNKMELLKNYINIVLVNLLLSPLHFIVSRQKYEVLTRWKVEASSYDILALKCIVEDNVHCALANKNLTNYVGYLVCINPGL